MNIAPIAPSPAQAPPSLIGFNALSAASKLQVKSSEIGAAISTYHGDAEHVYSIREKQALVAANAKALAAMRRAFALPYQTPQRNCVQENLPEFGRFRALARLLLLDSQVRVSHGDYAGAVNNNLDSVEIGVDVPRGGAVIAALVGNACEAIGDRPIWPLVEHLDAESAAVAARRLETITARRCPFSETVLNEKRAGEEYLADAFQRQSTYAVYRHINGTANFVYDQTNAADRISEIKLNISEAIAGCKLMLTQSKRSIFYNYSDAMDANIAQAKLPYRQDSKAIAGPSDPINKLIFCNMASVQLHDRQARLQTGLLLCTLALRAYRLRSGDYPGALTDLVAAGILRQLPDDPFAPSFGVPFRYRRLNRDKYVLYSVGPDGVDDGGRPVDLSRDDKPLRTFPEVGDKGDWVVGVNIGKPVLPPK